MRHNNIEIRMEVSEDEDQEPIAFLLNEPAKYGYTLCYAHIGQHSEAQDNYMYGLDFPKSPQDIIKAFDLVQELKSIGYIID